MPPHDTKTSPRPKLHITVPYWLNDPCAPIYDPKTDLYHLFYQCNPRSTAWGNIAWGHVKSKDLLHWIFMPKQPVLNPDEPYDASGVFTGGMAPIGADGKLHAFYSSVCKLPFHWSTPPYPRDSVGLATATSDDGGKTWVKSSKNPILKGEPAGALVSGFRDPYVAPWENMDRLRDTTGQWYGLISGGFDGKGPTSFLYAVDPSQPDKWQYLHPLIDLPMRWNPSPKWSGNFGNNWECVNFLALTTTATDSSISRDFLILGAEGDIERPHILDHPHPKTLPARTVRTQMWMQGDLIKTPSGEVRFKHNYSALFDHGPYYAANSFIDPKTSRRIVHGWIPEEDCTLEHAARKGWNGALAFPREVFIQTIPHVTGALSTPLNDITSIEALPDAARTDTYTIHTLGIRPISELSTLQTTALSHYRTSHPFTLSHPSTQSKHLTNTHHPTWSLTAHITIPNPTNPPTLGFHIRHSETLSRTTTLSISLSTSTISVNRSASLPSSSLPHFNTCPESGPFTLFTTTSGVEALRVQIVSDGDVLEVFVNERFAIATCVYTAEYDGCGGITAWVGEGEVRVEEVSVWDGLNGGGSCVGGL